MIDLEQPQSELFNPRWEVKEWCRLSACDNRPGLKKIYVQVLDVVGVGMRGVTVRFDTEPCEGIAWDHMNVYGPTDENGCLEWNHLGKPTRYRLWMEDDETPLVTNIRTDLGYEYCHPPGGQGWAGNVPINRPGIYSYRIEVQLRN